VYKILSKLVDECWRYSKPKQCHCWVWLKRPIFGVHDSQGSAETLVRSGGITNCHLIACSLSNISAKNYQNRLMCIEVIVCNVSVVFFETQCTSTSFVDCNLFQMGCFVVARFLLKSTSRRPSAIAELLVSIQHDWRNPISGVHVSKGSAETLVRRGGITNRHLIACSLSNISAKNYQNRLMCIEVIVCYISVVFWDTVYIVLFIAVLQTPCLNCEFIHCHAAHHVTLSDLETIASSLSHWSN